jgi:nucleotide-binding universal stress UspA family protein
VGLTIVVGVDGSEDSHRAMAWAAEQAVALGARVVAVHAVGMLEHERGDPSGAHLMPDVTVWTKDLEQLPPARLVRRLVPGDPVAALTTVAAEEHADMVVVGTRGVGAAGTLGSTSLQLAERSLGALVIVPRSTWSARPT